MRGFRFSSFKQSNSELPFDRLLRLFSELLMYTSGDVQEALDWMHEIDREHHITDDFYGMGHFIEDLKKKGYLRELPESPGYLKPGAAMEKLIRSNALDEIFGKLRRSAPGGHPGRFSGYGDEPEPGLRSYRYGDPTDGIVLDESIKNAMRRPSDTLNLIPDDLMVREKERKVNVATVLLIDISHSMILYGEDRITPAKKVALALSELILRKYPGDSLDIVVFGDDAWSIELKDLMYLQVGPFHTNTVAGLQLARNILRKKNHSNRQILMITDGKPSCIKDGASYYQNSFGLDRIIVNKTLNEAAACRRAGIHITTFMIARDRYLQEFISEFTQSCNGKAYYAGLKGLGKFVFEDFEKNRKKWM